MRSAQREGTTASDGGDTSSDATTASVAPTPDTAGDSVNPYADAWQTYWAAGWRGVLPLPERAKALPPDDYTGRDGLDPSYADCYTWADDDRPHNIGLRLPETVVGIDVDGYAGKQGPQTLAALEAECGPLPPTVRSTSRGMDQPSCIRLYRVAAGTVLSEKGLAGIEVVQRHHRYVVCWPSIHPSGQTYQWLDERTGEIGAIPTPEDLPELPAAWVARLRSDGTRHQAADLDKGQAAEVLAALPEGQACHHIAHAVGQTLDAMLNGAGRHPTYLAAQLAAVGHGRRGCPGAPAALKRMRAEFLAHVTDPDQDPAHIRTPAAALAEWNEALVGAVRIAVADAPQQGHGCLDDLRTWEAYLTTTPAESSTLETNAEGAEPSTSETDTGEPDPAEAAALAYQTAVRRAATDMRVREDARALIAAERAATAYNPPPVVHLPELIAQTEAERVRWRWEGLAEIGDRVLIEAKAKTGKTTFMGNLVESLLTGRALLDHFPTTPLPPEAAVVYVDTELGPRRLARWLGDALPAEARQRVTVWSLAGRAGSLDVRDDATRARMAAQVAEALAGRPAGFLVVDVAAAWTAPLGIDENDNATVRAFLESLHAFSLDLGAEGVALAHHTGHTAERSRGASAFRDWPDIYATITRADDAEDTARYLSALGRGIDVPESRLTFDPATRRLSLAGSVGLTRRSAARERIAAGYIEIVTDVVTGRPGLGTRELREAVAEALRAEGATVKAAAVGEAINRASDAHLIVNTGTGRRSNWQPSESTETPETERGHIGDTPPNPKRGTADVSPRVPDVSPHVSPVAGDTVSTCPRAYVVGANTRGTPSQPLEPDPHEAAVAALALTFDVPPERIETHHRNQKEHTP